MFFYFWYISQESFPENVFVIYNFAFKFIIFSHLSHGTLVIMCEMKKKTKYQECYNKTMFRINGLSVWTLICFETFHFSHILLFYCINRVTIFWTSYFYFGVYEINLIQLATIRNIWFKLIWTTRQTRSFETSCWKWDKRKVDCKWIERRLLRRSWFSMWKVQWLPLRELRARWSRFWPYEFLFRLRFF